MFSIAQQVNMDISTRSAGSFQSPGSLRSRASSIVSTGTKTSITTIPPPTTTWIDTSTSIGTMASTLTSPNGVDVQLGGHRAYRLTARPGSILSIRSFDHPCPPYSSLPIISPATFSPNAQRFDTSMGLAWQNTVQTSRPSSPNGSLSNPPTSIAVPRSPSLAGGTSYPSSRPSTPPTTTSSPDPESSNALSSHYTRIVRTIDTAHTAELTRRDELHAQHLATMRHEIDAAYRQEFRAQQAEVMQVRMETERTMEEERREVQRVVEETEARYVRAVHTVTGDAEKRADEAEAKWKEEEVKLRADMTAMETRWQVEKIVRESRHTDDHDDWVIQMEKARMEVEETWEQRWRGRDLVEREVALMRAEETTQREKCSEARWLNALNTLLTTDQVEAIQKAVEAQAIEEAEEQPVRLLDRRTRCGIIESRFTIKRCWS